MSDNWTQGYRDARDKGKSYADNPHTAEPAATAWAFGCSEGMKDRNRDAFARIITKLKED